MAQSELTITVTAENVAELSDRVLPYRMRHSSQQAPAAPNKFWDQIQSQIDRANELFNALTEQQQAEVVAIELALEKYRTDKQNAEDEQQRIRRRDANLRNSGCRPTDADRDALTGRNLIQTAAVTTAWEWFYTTRDHPVLLLSGTTGNGKTYAAMNLIATYAHDSMYLRADQAVKIFAAHFGPQLEQQERARDVNLLILDDVGIESDSARMQDVLVDIIDSRASARETPTVITTNCGKKQWAERYSTQRLMSRMCDRVRWEAITDVDMRRQSK